MLQHTRACKTAQLCNRAFGHANMAVWFSRPWAWSDNRSEPNRQKARTATAETTGCLESFHGSRAVILEASRWAPNKQHQEALGQQPNTTKTTNTTTGKRKQVQQQTAHEGKREGLIPTQGCGGPSTRRNGSRPRHRNTYGSKWRSNRRNTCRNTQAEAKATNMWWKLCNIRRMEVQVQSLHGRTRQHLPRSAVKSSKGSNSTHRCRTDSCSRNTWGSRTLDTTSQHPQVHPLSCSSNGVPTTPSSSGSWSIQAALPTFFNPPGNKEHRLPHKVAQVNLQLQPQQLRGVILNMGIRSRSLRARQQHTTTRPGQNSSSHEWDHKPFATASIPERRTSTNIPNDHRDHERVQQDRNSLCEASTTSVPISEHQSQWITGSNGHFSNIQRKRGKRQRTQRIQRKRKRKGYGYNEGYGKAKGKVKGKQVWQPVKGTDKGQGKNEGANNQGKGKNPVAMCYKCRQPGHVAKDCQTAVYNLWYY